MADYSLQGIWERMGLKTPQLSLDWSAQVMRMRQSFVRAAQAIETDVPQMAEIRDQMVDGGDGPLRARVYTPLAAGVAPGPGLVYYHGGGFVLGDLDTFDTICRRLADSSRCRVLSVDYRLAPEFKFPSQVNDATKSFAWAVDNAESWGVDPERIAVGGDSAGGNLSILITRAAKLGDIPPAAFQMLIYPLTQFANIRDRNLRLQEGPFFSPAVFDFFRSAYLPEGQDPMDPLISPLFMEDFSDLPPAYIVTAGWDPLRDEGRAFAAKLASAGVKVIEKEYSAQPHGFFNTTPVSLAAREALSDAGCILGKALGALS